MVQERVVVKMYNILKRKKSLTCTEKSKVLEKAQATRKLGLNACWTFSGLVLMYLENALYFKPGK